MSQLNYTHDGRTVRHISTESSLKIVSLENCKDYIDTQIKVHRQLNLPILLPSIVEVVSSTGDKHTLCWVLAKTKDDDNTYLSYSFTKEDLIDSLKDQFTDMTDISEVANKELAKWVTGIFETEVHSEQPSLDLDPLNLDEDFSFLKDRPIDNPTVVDYVLPLEIYTVEDNVDISAPLAQYNQEYEGRVMDVWVDEVVHKDALIYREINTSVLDEGVGVIYIRVIPNGERCSEKLLSLIKQPASHHFEVIYVEDVGLAMKVVTKEIDHE